MCWRPHADLHAKGSTAQSVHQRIRSVLEWAVAMEYPTDNPCDRVRAVLGLQSRVVKHMRALPHREVGSAIRKARRTDGMPVARLAFEFLVLTAARWGEVRWAEWSEIDLGEEMWTVPATRMKAKREHRVPLCRRAWRFWRKLGRWAARAAGWCSRGATGSRSSRSGSAS